MFVGAGGPGSGGMLGRLVEFRDIWKPGDLRVDLRTLGSQDLIFLLRWSVVFGVPGRGC